MQFLSHVAHFLTTASNWSGSDGILVRLGHQAELSAVGVLAAAVVGVGLGALLGHSGRGGFVVVNGANAARAVPSIALLTLLAIQPVFARLRAGGFLVSFIALFALAVPPVLTNAYVGVRNVDADVRSAACAMGMTGAQVLRRVELPLAAPLVMAGVRTAAVEVIATATLAAYVGFSDLGSYIFAGLATQNAVETFSGALLVAALALVTDLVLAAAGRTVTPAGVRQSCRAEHRLGVGADASTVRRLERVSATSH
ncbi:MAG: ABC transporter permease subunit [Acidimicrobiales bacterium]|jgi:osmoprotectant transport system permease protein